jgi:hypothetical protein
MAAACDSSRATGFPFRSSLEGTYVAESFNGQALPAMFFEAEGERHTLLADTLTFRRDGTVVYSHVRQMERETDSPTVVIYNRIIMEYTRQGLRVRFGPLSGCGPASLCIGISEGQLTPSGLVVEDHAFLPPVSAVVYRRLPDD